jgi:hypothetical protein
MFRKKLNSIFFIAVSNLLFAYADAQTQLSETEFSALNNQAIREKIFAHTDKNFYLSGEILWFKLYNVSADSLKASWSEQHRLC